MHNWFLEKLEISTSRDEELTHLPTAPCPAPPPDATAVPLGSPP